jgi:hypothetical protein
MAWVDSLGYAASLTVFATFCMSTMVALRIMAIASNVLFCLYGFFGHLYPVLILHLALLPINLFKLLHASSDCRRAVGAVTRLNSPNCAAEITAQTTLVKNS